MNKVTAGEYLGLKAKEKTLFNGLKWCLMQKDYKPFEIASAAVELKFVRDEIQLIESQLRNSLNKKKKTIAQATA